MPRRLTNALLLTTVLVLVVTGLVAWILPETAATPLYDLHRVAGVGLLLALPWKELVARTSVTRRIRRGIAWSTTPGVLATLALALTLALGVAWTVGLVSFDRPLPYSLLNVHVFAGIALVPLTAWHLLRRWERPHARDLTRRSAIRLLGLGAVAVAVGSVAAHVPSGRRVTGSKHAGSFTGNDFPLTIWAFDTVPAIDPRAWRLDLRGVPFAGPVSLDDVAAAAQREIDAIIDCTGGWWSEQRWRGASLLELLGAHGFRRVGGEGRSIAVTSVTGHSWTFRDDELGAALLATHVGGVPLSAGHGAPVRLVVPGRRGYQWIKWVGRVEVVA